MDLLWPTSEWNEKIEIENIREDDISISGKKHIDKAFTM